MSCYISSNNNRAYVSLEENYGEVGGITGANRIPLIRLQARQVPVSPGRRDKTGSRTFPGLPNRVRKDTTYRLNTLMTEWTNGPSEPAQGPLFQAALGAAVEIFEGAIVAEVTASTQIVFAADHGLSVGQAVAFAGEMRFVTSVTNDTTIVVNAPFTNGVTAGDAFGLTATYRLATELKSASIFDYWDPAEAVQRIISGASVDTLRVRVNGDYHEFEFAGPARDIVDSLTFVDGEAGLLEYPVEPAQVGFDYTVVPGHVGQVWMGSAPSRVYSLTSAELIIDNNLDVRSREFGSDFARCIAAGERSVRLNFGVFAQDDAESAELFSASRQRNPMEVMLQLGERQGQLFGIYMPAMVPEVPEFLDTESRLEWEFQNSRAQGAVDDELVIAFG
jgi:hypothetical protein